MQKTPACKPANRREARRLRAWELHQRGWNQDQIADALGVTQSAVSQWLKRAREKGVAALRTRHAPGPVPRLTAAERAELLDLLKCGAEVFGFRGNLWTWPRVAEVIRREFGVSYAPAYVGRILREWGWSLPKPIRRAEHWDEVASACWPIEE